MRMNRIAALTLGAGMLTMAACSDSPTAPATAVKPMGLGAPSFAVGELTDPTPIATHLKVCKTADSDVGGTFVTTDVGDGSSSGNPTISSPQAVAPGECRIVAIDNGDASLEIGDFFTVSENPIANVNSEVVSCTLNGGAVLACPATFFINTAHGWTILVRNTNIPSEGCTYTKGWYQNKNGAPTITKTLDGRTPDEQRAIFAATPGKPGNVTWSGGNNTLNLYQQLLAALNNVGGDISKAPASVQTAINNALAATGGSGLNITLVGSPNVGALTDALSNFNEGNVTGWPHCD